MKDLKRLRESKALKIFELKALIGNGALVSNLIDGLLIKDRSNAILSEVAGIDKDIEQAIIAKHGCKCKKAKV